MNLDGINFINSLAELIGKLVKAEETNWMVLTILIISVNLIGKLVQAAK